MKQIEVLQHQQPDILIVGIECQHRPQLIERITIESLRMLNEFYYPFHLVIRHYQLATVALKIWSQISRIILETSSSCTALSD